MVNKRCSIYTFNEYASLIVTEYRSWCLTSRCHGDGYRKKLLEDYCAAGGALAALYTAAKGNDVV